MDFLPTKVGFVKNTTLVVFKFKKEHFIFEENFF